MSDFPRVLALADHLGHPEGRIHGGTTYCLQVYPALKEAGVSLTVAFLSSTHPAADDLRTRGIEPLFFSARKMDFTVLRGILRLVAATECQVLHLANFKSQFLGRLAARRHRLPAIIHLHDTVPLPLHVKLVQRMVRSPDDLALAVSGPVAELGVRDYGMEASRVRVLHNAIDLDRFSVPRTEARPRLLRELGLVEPAGLIGMIGRLAPMKGHRFMIEALRKIKRERPEAHLLIVGEGGLRRSLEAKVADLDLGGSVTFAGQRNDIPELLAGLDLVAMPSISGEGLPYAAIEAIASGVPVVGYSTAGIPEVVPHERAGLLVQPGQVEPLANAIVRLLADERLRSTLSRGAREHSRQFALRRHVDQLMRHYMELAYPGSYSNPGDSGTAA